MKIILPHPIIIFLITVGLLICSWLLQYVITQWLLTFGITTSVNYWLCVLTNVYLVGLSALKIK